MKISEHIPSFDYSQRQ